MKNITNIIKTAETTTIARAEYIKAAAAHLKNIEADKKQSICKKSARAAADALRKYNAALQSDVFAAILTIDAPAIVTLSEVGYYAAAVGLDAEGNPEFSPAPLSLSAFIDFLKENGKSVSSPDTYAAAVKDAVDLSILKLAQGIGDDMDTLRGKLSPSDHVKALSGIVCTEETPESIGYGNVETHLQAAIDALVCIAREDGKNTFRVKRMDARYLEAAYGVNRVTGHIINPENGTRYEKIFRIMRRVIGGEAYGIEVKEKKEDKKAQ